MQRYFAIKRIDNKFILRNSDIHHIKNVMRMKENEKIEVVYEKKSYLCFVDFKYEIIIIENMLEDNELDVEIILAMALVKEQKMDFILQKATELGVQTIIPLSMDRSIVKISNKDFNKKHERWHNICKEASEQSKRNIIPNITEIMNLKELVSIEADKKILCSTKENKKLFDLTRQNDNSCDRIIIVVGPEGGITPNEEEFLVNNNYERISLGSRILRAETAAIYMLSILNYYYMR